MPRTTLLADFDRLPSDEKSQRREPGVGRQGMYKECVKALLFSVRVSQEIPRYLSQYLEHHDLSPFLIVSQSPTCLTPVYCLNPTGRAARKDLRAVHLGLCGEMP